MNASPDPPRSTPLAAARRLGASLRARVGLPAALAVVGLAIATPLALLRRSAVVAEASPAASTSASLPTELLACARSPVGPAGGAAPGPRTITARLGPAPLAELLRDAGLGGGEVYRIRQALEGVALAQDGGRLVASLGATGAVEALQVVVSKTEIHRSIARADGVLALERAADPPEVRLCQIAVRLSGDLSHTLEAAALPSELADVIRTAVGAADAGVLADGASVRIVARELIALGAFAGYDGLAALSITRTGEAGPGLRRYRVERGHDFVYESAQGTTYEELDQRLGAIPIDELTPTADGAPTEGAEEAAEPEDDAPKPKARGRAPKTVTEAAAASCSTSVVSGLSRQIIEEARCLRPEAFVRVPPRKNLVAGPNVVLYLEAPARDRLLKALDAHKGRTMTVNSALRTVAQQALLSTWGRTRRCGVKLAAAPGESNHESGLALDVREARDWRSALEAQGFRWMGRADPVHFDYAGPGAVDHRGLDVRAFQRLWTRNHPDDPLPETGKLDARAAARLGKAPPAGFAIGARCKR
jgi:hypothetical protein